MKISTLIDPLTYYGAFILPEIGGPLQRFGRFERKHL
jgi:hypothetical protein